MHNYWEQRNHVFVQSRWHQKQVFHIVTFIFYTAWRQIWQAIEWRITEAPFRHSETWTVFLYSQTKRGNVSLGINKCCKCVWWKCCASREQKQMSNSHRKRSVGILEASILFSPRHVFFFRTGTINKLFLGNIPGAAISSLRTPFWLYIYAQASYSCMVHILLP